MSDLMRLTGLNSGYDSEAMIEKMLQTYQAKIDTQNKKLTKLTWKQDAYRDIISKLTTFKNKYFDILKKDSYLLSPSSFKKFKTTITNKTNSDKVSGISVTTSQATLTGTHTIKVKQTATATKLEGKALTSQNFKLDLNRAAEFSEYTVKEDEETGVKTRNYSFALDVKVGDVTKSVAFNIDIDQDDDGNIDMEEFAAAVQDTLNNKFEEAFGVTGKKIENPKFAGASDEEVDAAGEPKYIDEQFLSVELGDDGILNFKVGGNATVTVAEKIGDFGLAIPSKSIAISPQSAITGINTVSVTANGVTKNVNFWGVSSTYFDTRNQPGNEAILAEYNNLKTMAYVNEYGTIPSSTQLDNYTYTSTQAARDKNAAALKSALNGSFASDGVTFNIDSDGNLTANEEFTITATSGGTLGIPKASASNKISTSATLKDLGIAKGDETVTFTINGKKILASSYGTVDDLIKRVNNSGAGVTMTYSNLEGRLIVTANDLGNGGDVEIEANKFTVALGLAVDEDTAMEAEIGRNAIIELDGVELYHNNNSYTFDGTTISFEEAAVGSEFTIDINKSYDDVKQAIKDFVKDYNQLVDDIYDYIGTAPKRDSKNNLYEPLTEDERAEMSDKEIENWETAAKQGILYNDSTVSSIMSNLRMVLYNSVKTSDGSSFGLFSMGIKTMEYTNSSHGKLQLDEDAFDKAFETHADDIVKLFTDTNNGVMAKVNNILDNAVRTTGSLKGTLVRKAGLKDSATAKDNEIYRQMEQINKRIKTLQDRYDAKENYWWKVFTNLEKMMANMNNQSSYLASYLGYTTNNNGNYQ